MKTTHLEMQASVNVIRALIGDRAGFRERRIIDAPDAMVCRPRDALTGEIEYPGCVQVRTRSFDGDNTFVVRLSDGVIVN